MNTSAGNILNQCKSTSVNCSKLLTDMKEDEISFREREGAHRDKMRQHGTHSQAQGYQSASTYRKARVYKIWHMQDKPQHNNHLPNNFHSFYSPTATGSGTAFLLKFAVFVYPRELPIAFPSDHVPSLVIAKAVVI